MFVALSAAVNEAGAGCLLQGGGGARCLVAVLRPLSASVEV